MQEIADEMGILKGSVYHYVKTKEDLLWMVVEPVLTGLVERARDILTGSAPIDERLTEAMISHATSFEDNYPQMFVMTRENGETLSPARREEIDALRREYFHLWRSSIVEGQERGEIRSDVEPSLIVHCIFGMLNWMFRWFHLGGSSSAREVAEKYARIAIDGLRPGQGSGASASNGQASEG